MTSNQTILITGASSGMGVNMAQTLAKQGHRVYAGMRDMATRNQAAAAEMQAYAQEQGLDIRPISLDVLSDDDVSAAIAQIESESSALDVLVNNAGLFYMGITEAFTLEQMRQQMEINFIAPMRMYRAVLPMMHKQQQGLIINTSSVAGRLAFPFMGLYCASKYALDAAAECFRYELSASNIDSVSIEPGPFNTGILSRAIREQDTDRLAVYGGMADVPGAMLESFTDVTRNDPQADPQLIADKLVEIIAMPYGQRPARAVVGTDFGSRELNDITGRIQAEALAAMEMAEMDPRQKLATAAA